MPLFSEHIANMYYGSSSPYTGSSYSYSSSVSPLGSSYSSSYLNPGSSYSNHSSLSSYSRAPLSSRWITSAGRNYSPMLTTISERGSGSPGRINSPRRIPYSSRTYGTPTYTPRPVNINTADIDVSRDRYKHKIEPSTSPKSESSKSSETPSVDSESSPFMPRVDGKPETGIDSSPGVERSTIKRGRTVVRLYTIKRNSPRKPAEESLISDATQNEQEVEQKVIDDTKTDEKEFMKWREKLSDDLTYVDKKEKKTLGAKLVEKFHVKNAEVESVSPCKIQEKETSNSQSLPTTPVPILNSTENKCLDRRCSMELLAEQANLLDSLIRSENLSTATLDLSKVGIDAEPKTNIETFESIKRRKSDTTQNPLKTTKSDYSLHESLKSYKDVRDPRNFSKRRSIKKSSSGSNIRRLDSITEFPKEQTNVDLPAIEEARLSVKQDKQKAKPKLKTKITSTVEISAPVSPLKFKVENVIVEEKSRVPKKEISYSSEIEAPQITSVPIMEQVADKSKEPSNIRKITKQKSFGNDLESPEPDDGNFWAKIGKRETVYLIKRKQNLDEAKEKNKRAFLWFPEDGDNSEEIAPNNINVSKTTLDNVSLIDSNKQKEIEEDIQKVSKISSTVNEEIIDIQRENIVLQKEFCEQKKTEEPKIQNSEIAEETSNENNSMKEKLIKVIPDLLPNVTKEIIKDSSNLLKENKLASDTISEKVASISKESKNIEKSSSLDAIDENKVKTSNQKKTKSDKSKKVLKADKKSELRSLKSLLPKPNSAKTEISENASSKNMKFESNKAAIESVQNCPIHHPVIALAKTVEKQLSKNQSTDQKTTGPNILEIINTNTSEISESIKDSLKKEAGPKKGVEHNTFNKLIVEVNSSKPSTSSNITQETAEQTETKEIKALDANKIVKIPQKGSPKTNTINSIADTQKTNELTTLAKTDDQDLSISRILLENTGPSTNTESIKMSLKAKSKLSTSANHSNGVTKSDTENTILQKTITPLINEETSTSTSKIEPESTAQKTSDTEICQIDSSIQVSTKTNDVPDIPIVIESQDIPNQKSESKKQSEQKTGEENKAENIIQKDVPPGTSNPVVVNSPVMPKKLIKEEKAVRPLIATPRPLQKKAPQVIHSSDSSDSTSEEESSDDDDEDESEASEDSAEFYECENNTDGRTSTGSNDSGFDSSAPTSPATFSQIKKDCDVNCHRKCEKLTANLCGVNQRLLVEALASRTASRKGGEASGSSSSAAPSNCNNIDIAEQQLEQSTAYDIFKKTGRFTPPARSIPRFRKYTVEDFQFIKVLGKGSFGKVLLAELRDTEYYYAVKCLKKDVVLEDDDVECTLIERKVLALGTNHPYLCHLFATFQTDSHLFFVMEYLNGGDLMFHIQQSGRFPEARARFYAAEIVSGLKFLHKRGIVYRDLKLDNILLDFEGHVRIADFGMCKLQIYLDKTADTFCGTPDYMAPEIIKGLKYNQTVDWWSFGVLLYEMLIGQSPFSGCDEDELFWSICNEMPSYPRFLSHEALTILTRLLDKDARTRLGGTECMHGDIRDQDFFHPIHWDKLDRRELETPFRPRVRHPMDTQYFDKAFTGERPRLTAVEPHVLRSMDQEPFRGFSYTNPNTTDR